MSAVAPGTSRTVPTTTVFPSSGGEPVTYHGCEIDEVDREGVLRIAGSRNGCREAASVIYAAWAAGSWTRAETVQAGDDAPADSPAEVGAQE